MIGHQQPGDRFALENVAFHDFRYVGFAADPIPNPFRVYHDAGAVLAVVQAAGLVRSDSTFQAQSFYFFLEKRMQLLGALIRTATARVLFGPLIDTDEYMVFENGHRQSCDQVGMTTVCIRAMSCCTSEGSRSGDRPVLPRTVEISLSRSDARWSSSEFDNSDPCPTLSLSNSARISRKSRCMFLCSEQLSQYHFGLWSAEGDSRS